MYSSTDNPQRVSRLLLHTASKSRRDLQCVILCCLAVPPPQVVLKPSPSLVHNNLCTVGTGLAYIHTRSVRPVAAGRLARAGTGLNSLH